MPTKGYLAVADVNVVLNTAYVYNAIVYNSNESECVNDYTDGFKYKVVDTDTLESSISDVYIDAKKFNCLPVAHDFQWEILQESRKITSYYLDFTTHISDNEDQDSSLKIVFIDLPTYGNIGIGYYQDTETNTGNTAVWTTSYSSDQLAFIPLETQCKGFTDSFKYKIVDSGSRESSEKTVSIGASDWKGGESCIEPNVVLIAISVLGAVIFSGLVSFGIYLLWKKYKANALLNKTRKKIKIQNNIINNQNANENFRQNNMGVPNVGPPNNGDPFYGHPNLYDANNQPVRIVKAEPCNINTNLIQGKPKTNRIQPNNYPSVRNSHTNNYDYPEVDPYYPQPNTNLEQPVHSNYPSMNHPTYPQPHQDIAQSFNNNYPIESPPTYPNPYQDPGQSFGNSFHNNQLDIQEGDLQARIEHIDINPIGITLTRDLIKLIDIQNSSTYFDYSNNGIPNKTSWVGPKDAILFYDFNHTQKADDFKKIVITAWSKKEAKTDFLAFIEIFLEDKNIAFDSGNKYFKDFFLWLDKNSNGKVEAGELISLEKSGIKQINFNNMKSVSDTQGGRILNNAEVIWEDDYVTYAYDLVFKYERNRGTELDLQFVKDFKGGYGSDCLALGRMNEVEGN